MEHPEHRESQTPGEAIAGASTLRRFLAGLLAGGTIGWIAGLALGRGRPRPVVEPAAGAARGG